MNTLNLKCSGTSYDGRFSAECGRPAKGIGADGRAYCGLHLGGLKRRRLNNEREEALRAERGQAEVATMRVVRQLHAKFPTLQPAPLYLQGRGVSMGRFDPARVIVSVDALLKLLGHEAE